MIKYFRDLYYELFICKLQLCIRQVYYFLLESLNVISYKMVEYNFCNFHLKFNRSVSMTFTLQNVNKLAIVFVTYALPFVWHGKQNLKTCIREMRAASYKMKLEKLQWNTAVKQADGNWVRMVMKDETEKASHNAHVKQVSGAS